MQKRVTIAFETLGVPRRETYTTYAARSELCIADLIISNPAASADSRAIAAARREALIAAGVTVSAAS